MPAPQKIIDLVKNFKEHKDSYLKTGSDYNEASVRQEYINPLFAELGWDMDNSQGFSENYRDVVHEANVRVGKRTKAPDYSFRIGGNIKFFVEAKRASIDVKEKNASAFQIRRYGWSAGLPICILTNFEGFAVYDTSIRPYETDRAGAARLDFFRYTDYVERWDELADLFSKENIQRGRLDKFLAKPRKGTQTVDEAFLEDIEHWREELAQNIHTNNPQLSGRDLNTAVQLTIDRIIFLRICEDRGIETENNLQRISADKHIHRALIRHFQAADKKYNSGLFHFKEEEGQGSVPDTLTPKLKIENDVLKDIFDSLYYPNPYEFSVMPPDILGQIYERFLGKVIRLEGKTAIVEEKPAIQIRKAGGVYYTPSHIVNYIIEHTLGDLLKDSTPAKVAKISILDPTCGSGSFLIVAYQYLLDWHLEYYLKQKKAPKGKIVTNKNDVPQLSIAERKNILTNNIYGTDIDAQAVEVTKLSLLLKVLEGADQDTIESQFDLLKERVLPDLGGNIKCGNSLIGSDFYLNKRLPKLHDDDHDRINVFDWDGAAGFPEIMKDGGFDTIIGNPPYISTHSDSFKDYEKNYYYEKFNLQSYQLNTYTMFIELGLDLLKKNGKFGYIIPNNWLTVDTVQSFRDYILSNTGNLHIVNYYYKVFEGAAVDTSTLIFEKTKPSVVKLFKAFKGKKPKQIIEYDHQSLIGKEVIPFDEIFLEAEPILEKMNEFKLLDEYAIVKAGIKPYETGKGIPKQTTEMSVQRIYHSDHKKDESYRKLLGGKKDVKRYRIDWTGQWIKYGKNLGAPRKAYLFEGERILVRRILKKPPYSITATITDEPYINNLNNMVIHVKDKHNIKVIVGLLNSKLMSFWGNATYEKLQRRLFPQFILRDLPKIPIALENKDITNKISDKVDELMDLLAKFKNIKNDAMQSKIKKLNDDLDTLAYQAYGLSKEDIDFIEKSILPVEPPKSP